MTNEQLIGISPHRVGGYERVTGSLRYLADLPFEDVLHVKLVTIPVGRGRIVSIDTSAAEAVPGVELVMTAEDLPQPVPRYGPQYQDRPVLAVGETKFHGEPVAAVAADSKDAAEEGARLVHVEYEELPGVYSVSQALAPDAPLVREPELRPEDDPHRHSNLLSERVFEWGDVDGADADIVIDERYSFPMITHFAIEPHAFAAAPVDDGIAIWSTIQHPYLLQKLMAQLLGMPLSKVRVFAPDPGGGFGGKQNIKLEPLVALMALETGRPVRLVLTLDESFQANRRTSAEFRVRSGFTLDGRLVFQDIHSDYLLGAYADIADRVVSKSQYTAAGPYKVPHCRITARSILSNTTPAMAFRGFGTPQVNWAVESNIDAAARALGIDRAEIRLRNLATRGEEVVPNDTPADGLWHQTVEKAMELVGWGEPLPEGHGRGLAVGIKSSATTGLSYSTVRLLVDGSVLVYAGTSDMGQGARTIFAQIAANEMGVPMDMVTVIMGDTAVVPYDQQTSASRSTVFMGNAIMRACRDIQDQVRAMAATAEGVPRDQVAVEEGVVSLPNRDLSIVEVVTTGLGKLGGELIGNGMFRKEVEPGHPLGGSPAFYEFNCTAVELSVDEETGHITIHKHIIVGDTGRSLHPKQVGGQDEGAAIMGLGHTLMEHMIYDEHGVIRNLGAIDYRIPTSMDLPLHMESAAIENEDGPGPYGSKGVSEGGLLAVQSAVGSAVADATGVVIRDLPLTPEHVWRSLRDARANDQPDD
ncbi:MAG: xanthine dehydrogenase family protein molybdopterin-binding subunit [Candidatus Limnocylindrales bacterium]